VNFDFNGEQRAIKEAAREMLADRYPLAEVRRLAEDERGFTDEQWNQLSELGWPGIFVSTQLGGQGLGIVELVILQEELGYALAPTPFFSNACAGLVLQAAGDDEQRERWLRPLAAGEKRGTLAVHDEDGGHSLDQISLVAEDSTLTGTKIAVADAATADFLIVGERDRPYLVEAGAEGATITPTPGIDPTRKLYSVQLEGVLGEPLPGKGSELSRALDAIPTALAAESTGVAQRAMEMAVEHAKERKQFDRPIGAYQAVSHRCAQMLLEVEGARSTTYYAAWALDSGAEDAALAASVAKSYVNDASRKVCGDAIQVHGGIGFTWEYDLHLYFKRAKALEPLYGDAEHHRELIVRRVAR
jgi:alkylation response protein AidB-like acyl-CoA dehydrogenase